MRAWLMKYNLWAIVDEKESEPPDDKAEEQKDWRSVEIRQLVSASLLCPRRNERILEACKTIL